MKSRDLPGLEVRKVANPEAWDALVNRFSGNPLQLYGWGEIKSEGGAWEALRLAVKGGDEDFIGGAQVLLRKVPFPFRQVAYVPRGPFGAEADLADVAEAVSAYVKRHTSAVVITFEPHASEDVPFVLTGGRPAPTEIMMWHTLIVDLTQSEEEIFADMSKSARKDIRRGTRNGIAVERVDTPEGIERCLDILDQTAGRADFSLHDRDYYRRIFEEFGDGSPVYLATHDGEDVSFLWILRSDDIGMQMYGGTTRPGLKLYAKYVLTWEVLKDLRASGVKRHDMNGLYGEGVAAFKQKFAGHVSDLVRPVDVPLSPLYPLWAVALPVVRRGMSAVKARLRRRGRDKADQES